ncbi:MAG: ribose 5-phosphate isomerase B [Gemmatimonadaceae bacterium]|nr:ribose 5-phosphate isomerase B [Gemmatimonadaceae bacterium]
MSRRPLITERDVLRARREGRSRLDAEGAVVTPAARDAAALHGITLARGEASTAVGSPARPAPVVKLASVGEPSPVVRPTPTALGAPSLRIAIGADHGGVALKDVLVAFLRERGADVHDVGTFGTAPVDYPDFAVAVARAVATGTAALGIMIDGAGTGSCMAANKVAGVRAAMCHDVTTAANAREHNNATVLTLGGSLIGSRLALEIVRTFLDTPFAGGRHAARVHKVDALDRGRDATGAT